MANKTVTKKQVKKNSKPEVKYDDWMMGRLKKNKNKCPQDTMRRMQKQENP